MENIYDVIVVGGGPAGLTAGIYLGRAKMNVLIIEKKDMGSLRMAHKIENYPGILNGLSGKEITELMKKQAEELNCKFEYATVLGFDPYEEIKIVKTDTGNFKSKYIIIATGTGKFGNKKIKGESQYLGAGVSYCATCDGAFTRGKTVSLVGKGIEILEEALFLTRYSDNVNLLLTSSELECDDELKEAVSTNEKIKIKLNVKLNEIEGDGEFVNGLKISVGEENQHIDTDFVFLYLGTKNNSEFFGEFADLSETGFIITNEKMETRTKNMYAIGDIREKEVRQVTTATNDGTIAATVIVKDFLKNKNK